MAKHHHQSNAEQIDNKEHGAETFHHEKVQVRAYHIYQEKGGSHLDNWLEAERTIRNIV
jgi:Protein of unknown function (DUF2934)